MRLEVGLFGCIMLALTLKRGAFARSIKPPAWSYYDLSRLAEDLGRDSDGRASVENEL
jgi:hypothetical protein